eukprot:scaffold641217_cov59-Attheya_sp.AAC.4
MVRMAHKWCASCKMWRCARPSSIMGPRRTTILMLTTTMMYPHDWICTMFALFSWWPKYYCNYDT